MSLFSGDCGGFADWRQIQLSSGTVEKIVSATNSHETKQAVSSNGRPSQGFNDFQKTLLEEAGELASVSIADSKLPTVMSYSAEEDGMDIDMEHPDESTVDTGPDQEMTDQVGEQESPLASPKKKAKFEESMAENNVTSEPRLKVDTPLRRSESKGKFKEVQKLDEKEAPISSEDTMQKYIRAAHGLQLEEFALYLIPLKASILARAVDMTALKRITLLDVGPQVAFWHLLRRLKKNGTRTGFHTIHTDDVSNALLEFISNSEGIKELYLHKKKKSHAEPEVTGAKVDLHSICRLAIRKHIDTLTHIMLKNEVDDTWHVDEYTSRMLSAHGTGLVEIAVSMRTKALHVLLQHLTSFTSLRALYILQLRDGSSSNAAMSAILAFEYVHFLADALIHFPKRKLKYVGIGEHFAILETPTDVAKRVKAVESKQRRQNKSRAQGKAQQQAMSSASGGSKQMSDKMKDLLRAMDEEIWDERGYDHQKAKAKECSFKWQTRFWEVDDVKVFQEKIRTGKIG